MISFIVPAHNEQACLGRTLQAIHDSARAMGQPYEVIVVTLAGFTGGAFMFWRREAFHATGGFDERLYWAEEGACALALKREGRFVVLWERVLTSGRRFRTMSGSGLQMLAFCARAVL